jgi:hypothetical protein
MKQEDYYCKDQKCPNKNRYDNCSHKGADGEVVQCVNMWAERKYYYLDRYLTATKPARKKYAKNGNAVYIDLFAGPGACRIKKTKEEILGGALRVIKAEEPFNRIILNDLAHDNYIALKMRTPSRAEIHNKDANAVIDNIVDDLSKPILSIISCILILSRPQTSNSELSKGYPN